MICTPIVAIICIAGLLVLALAKGIDGTLLASGLAILGGLGGYEIKVLRDKAKGGK